LLDIRRRLDALLFTCLLRHGVPEPHQAIVLRWFVGHARLTAARHSPLPRARRGLRLRVTGVLATWHLAPRTVVWLLDHREVVASKRVLCCCLNLNRSLRRLAASEFG
jgi:hypothetical protein